MSGSQRGAVYTMLSSIIYGLTPLLTMQFYLGGGNQTTVTFLRFFLALPLLVLLGLRQQQSLLLPARAASKVLLAGILASVTSLLLYSSYNYIPTGMATSIHFVYPLMVAMLSAILLHKRLSRVQVVGLSFGTAGVAAFMLGTHGSGLMGVLLSLLSGFVFSGYIMLLHSPEVSQIPCFVLSFHQSLVAATLMGLYGLFTGQLAFSLTPSAWLFAGLLAFANTVGASVLLQVGISLCGAIDAAILSLLEPLTSVMLGVLVLREQLHFSKFMGCMLIMTGLLATNIGSPMNRKQQEEKS